MRVCLSKLSAAGAPRRRAPVLRLARRGLDLSYSPRRNAPKLNHMIPRLNPHRLRESEANRRAVPEAASEHPAATERPWRDLAVPMLHLPDALDAALREVTTRRLRARGAHAGTPPEERGVDEQAAERMHGAYAGVYRALHEARRRLPGWQPRSSLEFGAALGAGSWAVAEVWPAAQLALTAVEPNSELRFAAAELWEGGHTAVGATPPPADWLARLPPASVRYDLVTAPYCLEGLPADALEAALDGLWERVAPGGLLALTLPASRSGFATLLLSRARLLDASRAPPGQLGYNAVGGAAAARPVAPCPHSAACPLRPGGPLMPWHAKRRESVPPVCHAEQLVLESAASAYLHRARRRGGLARSSYLEKVCYLVVQRRNPEDQGEGRGAGGRAPTAGRGLCGLRASSRSMRDARIAERSPRDSLSREIVER